MSKTIARRLSPFAFISPFGLSIGAGTETRSDGSYVVLENLLHGLATPMMLDLKMGTRTYGDDADPDKVVRGAGGPCRVGLQVGQARLLSPFSLALSAKLFPLVFACSFKFIRRNRRWILFSLKAPTCVDHRLQINVGSQPS